MTADGNYTPKVFHRQESDTGIAAGIASCWEIGTGRLQIEAGWRIRSANPLNF
jgi:hypothetical protein